MTFAEFIIGLLQLLFVFAASSALIFVILWFLMEVWDWWERRKQHRIDRIEAELDRASEELKEAVLQLAAELATERESTLRDMRRIAADLRK